MAALRPLRVRISFVPGTVHNLFNEVVEAPPEGVTYVFPAPGEVGHKPRGRDERPHLVARLRQTAFAKRVVEPALRTAPALAVKERVARARRRDHDLYHSVGSVHPLGEPWVLQFESSLDLFGFGEDWHEEIRKPASRRFVERRLRSCGFLLPDTEAARRSLLQTFPESAADLASRMEVCPTAIRAGPEPGPEPPGDIRFLFVGSRNFPKDFVPKGGHLVLAAFRELRKRRSDVLLTVRSMVPEPYRAQYADQPGLTILDGELPRERVDRMYEEHHAFVFPSANTPGMVIREAFRAARPAVTLDVWGNADLVEDGRTGFVVPPPPGVPFVNEWGALNWSHKPSFLKPFQDNVGRTVLDLADAMERLATDDGLRRRMGADARREIVSGRFSVGERNRVLRRAYDAALARYPNASR